MHTQGSLSFLSLKETNIGSISSMKKLFGVE